MENKTVISDINDIKKVLSHATRVVYEHYDNYSSAGFDVDHMSVFKAMVLREPTLMIKYPRTLIYDKNEKEYRWGWQGSDAREGWTINVPDGFVLEQEELWPDAKDINGMGCPTCGSDLYDASDDWIKDGCVCKECGYSGHGV